MLDGLPFRAIVAVDFEFEFDGHAGDRPRPVCMVAKELRSGQNVAAVARTNLARHHHSRSGRDTLFVAYYASAELGCFRALGWPMPARILDLFVEFRDRTNGLPTPAGTGLIGALTYFGLDTIGAQAKDEMRELILRGGPWSDAEREEILEYCATDVERTRAPAAGHAAAHRSAARPTARPLHGRRRGHGAQRHADRRRRRWSALRAHWHDIQDA